MEDLHDTIKQRLNKLGIKGQLDSCRIVEIANKALSHHCRAISVSRGILTVSCPSSVAAQEVQSSSHKIIKEINSITGRDVVSKLFYRIDTQQNLDKNT